MVDENGRQRDLDGHHVRRPLLAGDLHEAVFRQLGNPDDEKDELLVQLPHGRKQRKSAKENEPENVEPARSGAFFHRERFECITRNQPLALGYWLSAFSFWCSNDWNVSAVFPSLTSAFSRYTHFRELLPRSNVLKRDAKSQRPIAKS